MNDTPRLSSMINLYNSSKYKKNRDLVMKLTNDPLRIPSYEEVMEYIRNSPSWLIDDNKLYDKFGIQITLELVGKFPDFHHYVVYQTGIPRFPDYTLPLSIFASLSRYVGLLLKEGKNDSQVIEIMNYVDHLYTFHKAEGLAYVSEYLELVHLYELVYRRKFYKLLTPGLRRLYDDYFLEYLK